MGDLTAHDVVVVGAGNGGLSAAALLRRRGCRDVAIIEPSPVHVYKPLQNYVGTGLADPDELTRPQADLIPPGVRWYRTSAVRIDPATGTVHGADGTRVVGGDLLLAPGARPDWDACPGAVAGLRHGVVVTTFEHEHLARTARAIERLRSGRAVFTLPAQPVSGRETALKPLFLACDRWRRQGVLDLIEVVLVVEDERLHPVPAIAAEIQQWVDAYGIVVRPRTTVVAVDHGDTAVLCGPGGTERLPADLIHLVPRYAPAPLIADSGLDAPGSAGFLAVDPETLRHPLHPRIWGVGDGCDLGDARTGGALREQVKVAVDNLQRARRGAELQRYDGYTVAPIATAVGRLSFGEYDRTLQVRRSLPVPDQVSARRVWWWLDRHVLPRVYWRRILRGRL